MNIKDVPRCVVDASTAICMRASIAVESSIGLHRIQQDAVMLMIQVLTGDRFGAVQTLTWLAVDFIRNRYFHS